MMPEEAGPAAGAGGIAASKLDLSDLSIRLSASDRVDSVHVKEYQEAKREEALEQLTKVASTNGNGHVKRRIFGVARKDNVKGVTRKGDSFYTVER